MIPPSNEPGSLRKAQIMFVLCSGMTLLNAAAGLLSPVGGDLFGVASVLWGLGAVSYYFLDFDGKARR